MTPKGRGASHPNKGTGRGTQSGRLKRDSLHILSSRAAPPKYAATNIAGVLAETATLLDRLRVRFRRSQR